MTTRMLIDARHREETRVAVVTGNRIEEFDFESAERKQLKGNIYLAKVIRVEPSLQAAFVDYGGNRHGFLAFAEIHPDYYQIPREDREALLREEAEHAAEEAALRAEQDEDDDASDGGDDFETAGRGDGDDVDEDRDEADGDEPRTAKASGGNDDQVEALRQRRMNLRRRYKIQDVIHRRQVVLVQVVKEERGNKGAALTTYLSLAGRYCVLMPNTSHGGGISRKISNATDRRRLKSIMADLSLPASMGCIVRTAGLQRTRGEIKRDFDYLARLWDEIRDRTLQSAAPTLVYGDSDLVKRAIRDLYNKDIDEVIVEGVDGYRQARDFMRLLMPSHARRVKHYSDPIPLYQRSNVEDQLAAMYHPVVQLKSGGYLVINPTEALVSIDINSGRSTREHNIEQTATATNLEAAQEIGRQLRLRDMAGLVVIDFIDMDNNSNVRKVEKAMKDALRNDRARIQIGRISSFGLLEMSRQRLRTGVLEASTRPCPHCDGTGLVRTASSAGLSALRLIEDEAARGRGSCLTLHASQEAAIYVLNKKRADIAEIEQAYGVAIEILPDREREGARMSVEASGPPPAHPPRFDRPIEEVEDDYPDEVEIEEDEPEVEERSERADRGAAADRTGRPDGSDERGERGRRRRGRGRRRRGDEGAATGLPASEAPGEFDDEPVAEDERVEASGAATAESSGDTEAGEGRRRRGRRGRRRRGFREDGAVVETATDGDDREIDADYTTPAEMPSIDGEVADLSVQTDAVVPSSAPVEPGTGEPVADAPRGRRRPRARAAAIAEPVPAEVIEPASTEPASIEAEPVEAEPLAVETVPQEAAPKPRRRRKAAGSTAEPTIAIPAEPDAAADPARRRRPRRKADAPVAEDDQANPAIQALIDEPEVAAPESDPADEGDTSSVDTASVAQAETDGESGSESGSTEPPRRGWWQRTFGA